MELPPVAQKSVSRLEHRPEELNLSLNAMGIKGEF